MEQADKDTQDILTDADHIRSLIESKGWQTVKDKLDAKILDLQNINNLDMTDVTTLPAQLVARKMAVEIIWAWLKSDIYGFVEQQEANNQNLSDKEAENFIDRE